MWCALCELTIARTKFGVNMPKLFRDTASSVILASRSKWLPWENWVSFDSARCTESIETNFGICWPNHSKSYKQKYAFLFLLTTRWHSVKTLHADSSHACYKTPSLVSIHQYTKLLQRFSLRSLFACFL